MSSRLRHPLLPWVALAALLLLHLGVNVVWVGRDMSLRGFDEPLHMTSALHANNMATANGLAGVLQVARGRRSNQWPSTGYLPWVLPAQLFGQEASALRLYNTMYLALLLGALFVTGRRLHSPRAGLLAAATVSLYPAVFGAARQFNQDLPFITMVSLTMALLLWTERFGRPLRAALFGVSLGFAVLVRPHAAIFLWPPLALWAGLSLLRPLAAGVQPGASLGRARLKALLGLALGAATSLGVTSVWWANRLDLLYGVFFEHLVGTVNLPWMDQPSVLFYLGAFPLGASAVLLLLGLAGCVALVVLRRRLPARPGVGWELLLVAAWLVLGLAAISTFRVHLNRYQYPLYPALALLGSCGIMLVPKAAVRAALVGAVLLLGGASWLLCSFGTARPLPEPWFSCDPCGLTKLHEPWESAGPPHHDPLYAASLDLADYLKAKHGTGDGVAISTHPHLRLALMIKPALMSRLPLLQMTQRDIAEYGRNQPEEECEAQHQTLGGFTMPLPHRPYQHCYTLETHYRADHDPPSAPMKTVPGAQLVYKKMVRWRIGKARFHLWHHPVCPPREDIIYDPRQEWVVQIPCF